MSSKKWMPVVAGIMIVPAVSVAETSRSALDDVVVTATLSARDAVTSPAFTTVVTADDISKSAVNSLPDLLRETVGVNSKMDNTGRDEIQIRGMDGRYTLVLINGKRVSSGGALWRGGDFDYNTIPLSSIERIEIVRGPASALYGSDAIGGVVNIITREASDEWQVQLTGELRAVASGDDGDQARVAGFASGALGDSVSMVISGEYMDREGWYRGSSADPKEVAVLEEKEVSSLATTTTFQLDESQSLDLELSYNRDDRPYALWNYANFPQWNWENYSYHEQETERHAYGLTHNADWSWGRSVVFLKQEQTEIDDFNSDYNAPQQRNLKETNTYLKAYGVGELGMHALTAGVDLRRQKIEDAATYLATGEVTTDTAAVFAQDEISLTDQLYLTLGGRLDDHDVFGSRFSSKAYLAYKISDAVTVKGGISEAFKAPDAYQLSQEYSIISCGGNCFLSGNPQLTPETSVSYELGLDIRQDRWDMEAVVFYNDVKDMILAVYDPAGPSRQWSNIAAAETYGVELSGSADVTSDLSLSGNLTWMDTEYAEEAGSNVGLDNRPKVLANLGLDWQANERLLAFMKVNYTGEQVYSGNDLPGYTRVDVGANMDVTESLVMRAGIKNLTDVDLEDKSSGFNFNELGRNYYLSATYNF